MNGLKIGLKSSDEVLKGVLSLWYKENSLLKERTSIPSSDKFNFEYINIPTDMEHIRMIVHKDNPLYGLSDIYWIEDMKRLIERRESIIWNKIMTESFIRLKLANICDNESKIISKDIVKDNVVVLENYIEDLSTIGDGIIDIRLKIKCGVYTGIELK